MTSYRKSLALFVVIILLFELCVILIGNAVRPHWNHWGDEWHFQNTIKRFGDDISVYNLKHYEEMSTPLPFLAYALWGRIIGFDLFHLRILSFILAIVTYVAFHRLLFVSLRNEKKAFWGALLLVAQPYMIGFSIFVYTDMFAILFLVLTALAHIRQRPVLMGLALALAIMSRQYMAFLALGAGMYYLFQFLNARRPISLKMLIATVLSTVPYLLLVIWWGGPSPDSSLRLRYLDDGFWYHPAVLTLYISLIFVYLFPLVIYYRQRFYDGVWPWVAAFVGSLFYVLFPIAPSKPSVEVGIPTVGLFHRVLRLAFESDIWVHVVFYACFFFAVPVLVSLMQDIYRRFRQRLFDAKLFFDLSIASFFVVMPFSYLGWEKYFLPVVPLVIVRMLMARRWAIPANG